MIARIRPDDASSSRIASARSSGNPASNSVASIWVIASKSRCRTREEPPPSESQPARSLWAATLIGK